jgi:2',3'-cyclic-nucleotide 2'-phosphodiesterase (5'-nucleotidase family)
MLTYKHIAFYVYGIIAFIDTLNGEFTLTIVHNNDVHAHFDQINVYSGECTDGQAREGKCYGGEARRNQFIKGIFIYQSFFENKFITLKM